jgi:hypothetical protein
MYSSTVAIYSFVDDLLKALHHREDSRQQVPDAQVITVAVVAALHFGGNFEKANFVLSEFGWFSKRLSRSRFSRRLRRLVGVLQIVFHRVGRHFKDFNYSSRYLLDSFPVAVCDNIRISRCRLTRNAIDKESFRGKVTSKRRYFYGVRVQLLTTETGLPVEIAILPGACSDLQGISELAMDLPKGSKIFLDAGYTEYNFEDFLAEQEEIQLMISRKKNSKRLDVPAIADFKQLMRKFIETTIGEIEKLFPKKIHVTDLDGFLLKILLFVFAYQLNKAFLQ